MGVVGGRGERSKGTEERCDGPAGDGGENRRLREVSVVGQSQRRMREGGKERQFQNHHREVWVEPKGEGNAKPFL